jgi:hypothetical protein
MAKVALDIGRANVKAHCPTPNGVRGVKQFGMPSIVAVINREVWERDSNGGSPPDGFIQIGKRYYVVGERAKQYGGDYKMETSRLTSPDFYLPLLMYSLAMTNENGSESKPIQLVLGLTYSSGDYKASKQMKSFLLADRPDAKNESLVRSCITHRGVSHFNFVRNDISLFDEPFGTLSYLLWDELGHPRKDAGLRESLLILDNGGHTVDVVPVHSSGGLTGRIYSPQLSQVQSLREGVLTYQAGLWQEIREAHWSKLKDMVQDPGQYRLDEILRTDQLVYGKTVIDVTAITKRRKMAMAAAIYEKLRGYSPLDYGQIFLTGGGSHFIFKEIARRLPDFEVRLAMSDSADQSAIQFVNARGVARLLASVYGQARG